MRKRKTIYICDHCGDIALEDTEFGFGFCYKTLPRDWTLLGREHLCPKCTEIYNRFKKEVCDEQQKSVIDNRHIEIKKYIGKLEVTKHDKL